MDLALIADHGTQIEAELARRVLPILARLRERWRVIGSGTLLAAGGDVLLVTARHVAERIERPPLGPARCALPRGDGAPLSLAGCRRLTVADEAGLDADICALRLPAATARALLAHWRVLTPADLRAPAGDDDGWHLLSGYPQSLDLPRNPGRGLFSLATRRLPQAPSQAVPPVHPRYDLFFEYARLGRSSRDGAALALPGLEGVSGAPVWRLQCEPAAGAVRLWPVAIQSGYRSRGYIRAKDLCLLTARLACG